MSANGDQKLPFKTTPLEGDADNSICEKNPDIVLSRRLASGDSTALRSLMERHVDRLYIVAHRIVQSPDLAGEAVQNTFLQLWERRVNIDPSQNLGGLLTVMTRNNALKMLRHERVHERISSVLQELANDHEHGPGLNNGIESLECTELWTLVHNVLEGIPPRSREIFLLHWEHGLSYAEIEKFLGISNATIRNQMSRAMKHLTTVVDPDKFSLWRNK